MRGVSVCHIRSRQQCLASRLSEDNEHVHGNLALGESGRKCAECYTRVK